MNLNKKNNDRSFYFTDILTLYKLNKFKINLFLIILKFISSNFYKNIKKLL